MVFQSSQQLLNVLSQQLCFRYGGKHLQNIYVTFEFEGRGYTVKLMAARMRQSATTGGKLPGLDRNMYCENTGSDFELLTFDL